MFVPSNLPYSTGGKQRRQIKHNICTTTSPRNAVGRMRKFTSLLGVIILVIVEQGPSTIKHQHLPSAAVLFFPHPVTNQNRIMSVTVEGWHRQPKGHQQPGPTAWAVKGLRAKEASCQWRNHLFQTRRSSLSPPRLGSFREKKERRNPSDVRSTGKKKKKKLVASLLSSQVTNEKEYKVVNPPKIILFLAKV